MIVLHHLENSRSFRILWLLEELGLEYELVKYQRDPQTNLAMDDLKSRHPLGKAPILEDEDMVIAESGAIIEHLLDNYDDGSKLRPPAATPGRVRYNTWMHAAEGSVMNLLLLGLFFNRMETRSPFLARGIVKKVTGKAREAYLDPSLKRMRDHIEAELERHTWFAGEDFSAADIQMGFVLMAMAARGGLDEGFPNCQRWMAQAQSRSAYKDAMDRNGEMKLVS